MTIWIIVLIAIYAIIVLSLCAWGWGYFHDRPLLKRCLILLIAFIPVLFWPITIPMIFAFGLGDEERKRVL